MSRRVDTAFHNFAHEVFHKFCIYTAKTGFAKKLGQTRENSSSDKAFVESVLTWNIKTASFYKDVKFKTV